MDSDGNRREASHRDNGEETTMSKDHKDGAMPMDLDPIPPPVPTPNADSDAHLEYIRVTTRNAKCDKCEQRNISTMQKCKKCGMTTCKFCHDMKRYDSRHVLTGLDLDWTYEPLPRRRTKRVSDKAKHGDDGKGPSGRKGSAKLGRPTTQPGQMGVRRGLVREPVTPNPEHPMLIHGEASADTNPDKAHSHSSEAAGTSLPNAISGDGQGNVSSERQSEVAATPADLHPQDRRKPLPTSRPGSVPLSSMVFSFNSPVPTGISPASSRDGSQISIQRPLPAPGYPSNGNALAPTAANYHYLSTHWADRGRMDLAQQYASMAARARGEMNLGPRQHLQQREHQNFQFIPGGQPGSGHQKMGIQNSGHGGVIPQSLSLGNPNASAIQGTACSERRVEPPGNLPATGTAPPSTPRPFFGGEASTGEATKSHGMVPDLIYYAARGMELMGNRRVPGQGGSKEPAPEPAPSGERNAAKLAFLSPAEAGRWTTLSQGCMSRQWELLFQLNQDWDHNPTIQEARRSDPLGALDILQASLTLQAMREDLPNKPSWALWDLWFEWQASRLADGAAKP